MTNYSYTESSKMYN